uniref:Capsid assembly protein n=1 Tax=viral metagenome TaxID=1070528 RepID=A0A6M3K318_9ZZZZ
MGNEWKEQFSREELESMGEDIPENHPDFTGPGNPTSEPEPNPEPEPEPEPTPEPKPAGESSGEPEPEPEPELKEGEPVPYDRFAKIYGQRKQAEREKSEIKEKLDLFKKDPDEYYAKYPDEKPDGYSPLESGKKPTEKAEVLPMSKMLGAQINDPQNPSFHGRTLREIMESGPEGYAAAQDYYNEYVEDIRGKAREAEAKKAEELKSIQEEDGRFMDAQAQALFKKPAKDLDAVQKDKIEKITSDTLAWMKANNRMGYKLADAYKIMTYDKALSDAAASGADGLVNLAKSGTRRSVSSGSGKTSKDPYDQYLAMSEDDLSKMIAEMPDAEFVKFLKEATPAFREKYPSLPYLN